jgi:hypothetical protein
MVRILQNRLPLLALASACIALTGCGGNDVADGNTVEMRDMEVLEGTVNDSMTDLDAVRPDGVGSVSNAGSVSRAQSSQRTQEDNGEDTETVAAE